MNTATRKTAPKSRRIVTLDASQYALYQTGNIELHSPTGELLDTVGTLASRDEAEVSRMRLQDQLYLVECLLCNGNYPLELNERAGAGLVDLLHQANEFLN